MNRHTASVAVLMALLLAAPASAGSIDIEQVIVARSTSDVITFRVEFAVPVTLHETRVQVALDTDGDRTTGTGGIDYALDWTGSPALLKVHGEEDTDFVETHPPSLRFRHESAVASFSIAASRLGNPTRLDFYVFVERAGTVADVVALDESGPPPAALWTYPMDPDFRVGDPYPTETYPDFDDAEGESAWDLAALAVGVVVLGLLATVIGIRGGRHAACPRSRA